MDMTSTIRKAWYTISNRSVMKKKTSKCLSFVVLFITISILWGCKETVDCCVMINIDKVAYIAFSDENGNDLLDPDAEYPKSLDTKQLRFAYIVDGNEQVLTRNGDILETREIEGISRYVLKVSLNDTEKEDSPITLLKWSEEDIDVIKASFHRANDGDIIVCTKVVWNDEVVWEAGTGTDGRVIEIIK